jgi:hypothetical protein
LQFAADIVSSSSYGEVSEVQRALLVLLVWLQIWDGSRHIPELVWRIAVDVGLPLWTVATTNLPRWVQNPTAALWENFSTLSRMYNYCKDNKFAAIGMALMLALIASRVLGAFSTVFTLMIWWGASLKTTKAVHKYV